jgi:hypothetical protein
MSSTHSETTEPTYAIEQRAEDGTVVGRIGRLAIGADGRLRLVDATAEFEEALQDVLGAVNAAPSLRVKIPTPGSASHGITWQSVARDDPAYAERLGDYFKQKYDLHLISADEDDWIASAR